MNPEILRAVATAKVRDARVRADRERMTRTAVKAARGGRKRPGGSDDFAALPIPDYVDGSFRAEPADEAMARS